MREFLILFVHLIVTVARLARPGGVRSVVAESVLVRHQLLVLNRGRKRAPKLHAIDRIIAGSCTLFMRRARLLRNAIVLKPSTLLHFHSVLRKRKYRMLFASQPGRQPGPKGPTKDLIDAVVAMKHRNPIWGCPRIAQQIALAFGVEIDKDVVRRILAVHYRPESDSEGPSWLTFIGHMKESVELRFVPMRIGDTETPLGSRCDGPIYASGNRVWCPQRHRGWSIAVPDVSASDPRARSAEIPQLGS
jgi:putative transposase